MKAGELCRSLFGALALMALFVDGSLAIHGSARALPFPDGTRVYPGDQGSRIEYCPDNTCTVFSAVGSAVLDRLSQYAFLYLYEHGDFYALEAFRAQVAQSEVTAIVREAGCESGSGDGDRSSAIDCALMQLERLGGVSVYGVRLDENGRWRFPVEKPRR